MLKKLFGGDKGVSAPATSHESANRTINTIQKLVENEEQLEKRKELLEKRIAAELDRAKAFSKQQKKAQALTCLKRKKLLENEITNVDNLINRLIEQRTMIEGQRTTVEAVHAMHLGAQIAQANMKDLKMDKIDKVVDDINETNEKMKELQAVMAAPMGGAADLDDDDLLNELNDLEEAELDNELLEPAAVPHTRVPAQALPTVPQRAKPAPAKTTEELELEALQAELA